MIVIHKTNIKHPIFFTLTVYFILTDLLSAFLTGFDISHMLEPCLFYKYTLSTWPVSDLKACLHL